MTRLIRASRLVISSGRPVLTERFSLCFLSFVRPAPDRPELVDPTGQAHPPAATVAGPNGTIAHFIVGPDWPGGDYRLAPNHEAVRIPISNRARQFTPPPIEHQLQANFAGQVTLLGYDLPQRRVQPGGRFPVTLHLRSERTMGQNLVIFNHLLDRQAVQRGGGDRVPLNYYTTLLLAPGEIVSDAYRVPVEPAAPPGVYWLDVGLYPSDQPGRSLALFSAGQPVGRTSVQLGPVKVGGPPPGVTVAAANPQQPLNVAFGSPALITLLGFDLAGPAQPATLTLYWQAGANPSLDYTIFVHLLDPAGQLAGQADGPPANGAYPTSLWDPGEIIVDPHALPELPAGRYRIQLGLYRPDTGERLPAAGSAEGAVHVLDYEVGQ